MTKKTLPDLNTEEVKDFKTELPVKHKKKKHKQTESELQVKDQKKHKQTESELQVKHKKKKHRDSLVDEENDIQKDLSGENDNQSELPIKHKKKKRSHSDSLVDEENTTVKNEIDKKSSKTSDGECVKTKKRKHKDSISIPTEESATTENNKKYSAEYFGDKPAKAKKKKKVKKMEIESSEKSEETEGPSKKDAALDYLRCWKSDREHWKFQKIRQVWLLQHLYQVNEIPDDSFAILLSYLDGLKGKARETTIAEAEKLLESQESDESDDDTNEEKSSSVVKDPVKYERARQLLQALS